MRKSRIAAPVGEVTRPSRRGKRGSGPVDVREHGRRIDDAIHASKNLELPAAVLDHFYVEPETTVLVIGIQRREDFLMTLDLNELIGLKIQFDRRRLAQSTVDIWIRFLPAIPLDSAVQTNPESVRANLQQQREHPESQPANHVGGANITGRNIP